MNYLRPQTLVFMVRRTAFAKMAKTVVVIVGSNNQYHRWQQQPQFIGVKYLFGNQEKYTHTEKNGRRPLLVVFNKTMVQ